jgi:ketosteroid isomerase-like protein
LRGLTFPIAATVLLGMAACGRSPAPPIAAPAADEAARSVVAATEAPELQAYLASYEQALGGMFSGDPTLWLELASHADDATLFPPFGGFAKGWDAVSTRYRFAAGHAERGAKPEFSIETIASGTSGDLAYVVALERSRFPVAGSSTPSVGFTRVTHILRRERGEWKLLHRHMDHLPEQFTLPEE